MRDGLHIVLVFIGCAIVLFGFWWAIFATVSFLTGLL